MMDEYFMHLKERYPEIRGANRFQSYFNRIFYYKSCFFSCL